MATVPMSMNLKHSIICRLESLFTLRLKESADAGNKAVDAMKEDIRKAIVPDALVEIAFNKEFQRLCHTTNNLQVYTEIEGYSFNFNLVFPYHFAATREYRHTITATSPMYARIREAYTDWIIVTKEKNDLISNMHTQLNGVSTLKQLVKIWPSALDFVDSHTRDRYHEVVKYERRAVTANFDDDIKSGLLKARIINDAKQSQ